MSTSSPDLAQPIPLQLMVVDVDPVFRLGLVTGLAAFPDVAIVAEASQANQVFEQLTRFQIRPVSPDQARESLTPTPPTHPPLDLLLLDVEMAGADVAAGLTLCQQVKMKYPGLPLVILTRDRTPATLTAARQVGVAGYWPKGTALETLVPCFRQIAEGAIRWAPDLINPPLPIDNEPPLTQPRWRAFTQVRQGLRNFSLAKLSVRQAHVDMRIEELPLSWYERQVVAGLQRELKVAHWCLDRVLPAAPSPPVEPGGPPTPPFAPNTPIPPEQALVIGQRLDLESVNSDQKFQTGKRLLLDAVLAKLPANLHNQTRDPQEIDILNPQKKQELLILILKRFEDLLDELRFSQVPQAELVNRQSQLLTDLWQAALTDYFGKYMTITLGPVSALPSTQPVDIVAALLQDQALVETAILDHIPQVTDLCCHLLWQTPLIVDNMACAVGSPEAVRQAQALLENLTIQIANAVVQPLLNRFASTEVVKQRFYDRRLLSTRDIERFRNALSWKYRLRRWLKDPQAMFESQYSLIVFGETGLKQTAIYAARDTELQQLSGWPLLVTLALETRDAIAPPLRATFTVVGRGVVYVLTQFVGRGLGLVGRGILQGIGSTWHDMNLGRQGREDP